LTRSQASSTKALRTAPSPSGKARVCKTRIRRFESARCLSPKGPKPLRFRALRIRALGTARHPFTDRPGSIARFSAYDRAVSVDVIAPRLRIAATGRPLEDPGCAGCRQLALLRALRRAGLVVQGGLGCAPPVWPGPGAPHGRVARLAGAVEALVRAGTLVAEGRGVALLAVADRGPHRGGAVAGALAAAGARVVHVPADVSAADAERIVAEALTSGPVALVALAECARREAASQPFAIHPARCNRCGSCLGLGCVALSDPGGETIAIDPARCVGCGRCAPLCRGGAIRRACSS
jgi:NAD-dependent dihydropyrimidine dehydrogenase PreA subunit